MLIKHGADKNAKDIGFTALHIAAQEGINAKFDYNMRSMELI